VTRRRTLVLTGLLAVAVVGGTPTAAPAGAAPAHTLELRPVLAEVPGPLVSRAPTAGEAAAIASCDPTRVQALTPVPVTSRASITAAACAVLPFAPRQGRGALYVGPSRLTARDVKSARAAFAQGQGNTVIFDLTRKGLTKFNRLARDSYAQAAPRNEVAITVDGAVVSNPVFESASFEGPVQISGNFSKKDAKAVAGKINQARRSAG